MDTLKRSEFLKIGLLSLLAGLVNRKAFPMETGMVGSVHKEKVPVIHATDLYHFHCDPDDHWDLATVYALAYLDNIEKEKLDVWF